MFALSLEVLMLCINLWSNVYRTYCLWTFLELQHARSDRWRDAELRNVMTFKNHHCAQTDLLFDVWCAVVIHNKGSGGGGGGGESDLALAVGHSLLLVLLMTWKWRRSRLLVSDAVGSLSDMCVDMCMIVVPIFSHIHRILKIISVCVTTVSLLETEMEPLDTTNFSAS